MMKILHFTQLLWNSAAKTRAHGACAQSNEQEDDDEDENENGDDHEKEDGWMDGRTVHFRSKTISYVYVK